MSSTIIYYYLIPFISVLLLSINFILAPHNPYMQKNGAFECGYTSFLGQSRTQFSISFFIFALLFLLFDLEILLVYPYLVSSYDNEILGLAILLIFLLVLIIGFAFELGKKALTIESRQTKINYNNFSNKNFYSFNSVHDKTLSNRTFATQKNVLSKSQPINVRPNISLFSSVRPNISSFSSVRPNISSPSLLKVMMFSTTPILGINTPDPIDSSSPRDTTDQTVSTNNNYTAPSDTTVANYDNYSLQDASKLYKEQSEIKEYCRERVRKLQVDINNQFTRRNTGPSDDIKEKIDQKIEHLRNIQNDVKHQHNDAHQITMDLVEKYGTRVVNSYMENKSFVNVSFENRSAYSPDLVSTDIGSIDIESIDIASNIMIDTHPFIAISLKFIFILYKFYKLYKSCGVDFTYMLLHVKLNINNKYIYVYLLFIFIIFIFIFIIYNVYLYLLNKIKKKNKLR